MSRNDRHTYLYRIEITANVQMTSHGRDTRMSSAALEQYRQKLNASFQPGGVNAPREGIVPHISRLVMIAQHPSSPRLGQIVAEASAPLFEVV